MGVMSMSARKLGTLLRMRREELELTQEELADGICSVPTLSRIENGERMPTKNHFETLVERLGLSSLMLDCFIDENTLRINELKYQTQLCYINREYDRARECPKPPLCKGRWLAVRPDGGVA